MAHAVGSVLKSTFYKKALREYAAVGQGLVVVAVLSLLIFYIEPWLAGIAYILIAITVILSENKLSK